MAIGRGLTRVPQEQVPAQVCGTGAVLERLELALGDGVVVAAVGSAVRLGQVTMMMVCRFSSLPRLARLARVLRTLLERTD